MSTVAVYRRQPLWIRWGILTALGVGPFLLFAVIVANHVNALLASCGLAIVSYGVLAWRIEHYRTNRIAAEEQLRSEHAAAVAAHEAKGRMLAVISHEIRTPLHSMLGITDLLLHSRLDEAQRELVNTLRRAAMHQRDIVNDTIDLERIAAGKMPLEHAAIDWRALTVQVQSIVQPQFQQAGVHLHIVVDHDVPLHLAGDLTRLRQILLNLLGNAVRFTPRGGSVSVRVSMQGEAFLRCTVSDSGPGVPTEKQQRIFDPFTQANVSTARTHGGSGLGLHICRLLVNSMGGRIGLDSIPGCGAAFWFELPAETAVDLPTAQASPSELAPAPEGTPANLRLLVAEDDATCAFTISHMLTCLGYQHLVVADGAAAVSASTEGRWDLILLDLQMPVMDGITAASSIRSTEQSGLRVPILALSADHDSAVLQAVRAAGMDAMIPKPLGLEELQRAILSWRRRDS